MSRYSDPATPCGLCGGTPTRWIAAGPRCRADWPEQPQPDPARTYMALLARNTPAAAAGQPVPVQQAQPAPPVPPEAQRAVQRATARARQATAKAARARERQLLHGTPLPEEPAHRYADEA